MLCDPWCCQSLTRFWLGLKKIMEIVKKRGAASEEMVPLTLKKNIGFAGTAGNSHLYLLFPLGDSWHSRFVPFFQVFFIWAYIVKIPGFVLKCLGMMWEQQVWSSVPLNRQVNSSQMPPYLLKWRKELTLFWYLIRTVLVLFYVRHFLCWHVLLFLKEIVKLASATERWLKSTN